MQDSGIIIAIAMELLQSCTKTWLLWVQILIDILPQFLQLFMQYLTILDRVIMALNSWFDNYATALPEKNYRYALRTIIYPLEQIQ